jgi:predicted SprT family Zn-dependent metalloprotease
MVERFNTLLKEVKDDLHGVINYSSHIMDDIRLLNKTNKRTLGKCRKWMGGTYEIYLNPMLLEMSDQLIKDVIAHELIHTVEGCFDHGFEFKKQMGNVNLNCNNYKVEVRTTSNEWKEKRKYKYKLTCKKCGAVVYRNKLIHRYIKSGGYTHKCGGDLEIEQLY